MSKKNNQKQNLSRVEMMAKVVKKYGFENEKTINFCKMAEKSGMPLKMVAVKYKMLMEG